MKPMFFFIAILITILPSVYGRVIINEVMYSPIGNDDNLEWIELYNDGASAVDLSNYKADGNDFDDASILARGFLVVARQLTGNESFASTYGNKDGIWNSSDGFSAVDGQFVLTNTGKTINLTDNAGNIVDTVSYTGSIANDNGKSLERTNPSVTNFKESRTINGSPGTGNSVFNSQPVISAVPDKADILIGEDKSVSFVVTASDPQNDTLNYQWSVDSVSKAPTDYFSFNASQYSIGKHAVSVNVSDGEFHVIRLWNVTTSNIPVSGIFNISYNATNGIDKATNVAFATQQGKIDFAQQQIDLRDVVDVDAGIKITQDNAGIDTVMFPALAKNATITFSALSLSNPLIVMHSDYNGTPITPCTACSILNKTANSIIFAVPAFSQYKAAEFSAIYALSAPSGITINILKKGETASATFSIKNTGSLPETNVMLKLAMETGYDANMSAGNVSGKQLGPYALASGESKDVSISTFIAFSQDVKNAKLGTLTVTSNELPNKTIPVMLSFLSKLGITKISAKVGDETKRTVIDGSSITSVHPGSPLSFEITLANTYTQSENIDIDDISLEAVLKGVEQNGDDLDEDVALSSLQASEEARKKLVFQIPMDAEDKTYQLTIQANGVDEFNQVHAAKVSMSVVVEKELHDLRITKVEVSPQEISCGGHALLEVLIKNMGRRDEEKVRLDVSGLGIDFSKKDIKLTDDSLKETSEFLYSSSLEVPDNSAGSQTVTARVYRDNQLEEEKTAEIIVKGCEEKKQETPPTVEGGDRIIINEPFAKKIASPKPQQATKSFEVSPYVYAVFGALLLVFLLYLISSAVRNDHY